MKTNDICSKMPRDTKRFYGAPVVPVFNNSLFTRDWESDSQPYSYTRGTNPTVDEAELMLSMLEGTEAALCFASGMAAISSAVMSVAKSGDHIVSMKYVYGGTVALFDTIIKDIGVETTYVEGTHIPDFEAAFRPNTKLLYIESPSWIFYEIVDIRAICEMAHKHGVVVAMDNTWASMMHQNPHEYGVDISLYSASKYLGGHSDIVAGVATGSKAMMDKVNHYRCTLGGIIAPDVAWLLARSLRSLPYRMRAHSESCVAVVDFLTKHPKVKTVYHPSLPSHPNYDLASKQLRGHSPLMGFTVLCGDNAQTMLKNAKIMHSGPSWGGFETMCIDLTPPKAMQLAENERYFRLSVGLEDVETVIADLEHILTFA